MYNYFLFDWDGCLADTLPIWAKAWQQTFTEFGVSLTKQQVIDNAFGNWQLPDHIGVENVEFFVPQLYRHVEEGMQMARLNESVKKTLDELKQLGKKIAVVTSSKKSALQPLIAQNGMIDYFDVFLGEEDITHFKPHPEILIKAMSFLQAPREETIVIGDSHKDIEAGQAAGIDTGIFFPIQNQEYYLESDINNLGATYKITSFDQVLRLANTDSELLPVALI